MEEYTRSFKGRVALSGSSSAVGAALGAMISKVLVVVVLVPVIALIPGFVHIVVVFCWLLCCDGGWVGLGRVGFTLKSECGSGTYHHQYGASSAALKHRDR